MVQEKALAFAKQLNVADFKSSAGWLHSFKARHNISGGLSPHSSKNSSIMLRICTHYNWMNSHNIIFILFPRIKFDYNMC